MITISYSSADAALARRVMDDLQADGYAVNETVQPGHEHVHLLLLSESTADDSPAWQKTYAALDNGQHVIPVLTQPVALPDVIDHLQPVDLSSGYDYTALKNAIDTALSPRAGIAMRAQTPRVRQANQRFLIGALVLVLVVFIVGIYLIIEFDIESPADEYERVDTEVALTRDVLIGPTMEYLSTYLPRGTEQAEVFPGTLEAVPTLVRPFVGQTATAIYEGLASVFATPQALTATPNPDAGE